MTDCEKQLRQSGIANANLMYDTVGGSKAFYGLQFLLAQLYDRVLQEYGPEKAHLVWDALVQTVDQIHDHAAKNDENGTSKSAIERFT